MEISLRRLCTFRNQLTGIRSSNLVARTRDSTHTDPNGPNCRFAGSYSWEHVFHEPFAVGADVGFQ